MPDNHLLRSASAQSNMYQICIKEGLSREWQAWFDGMTAEQDQYGQTVLVGQIRDQAQLHGLLKKIRNFGLTLISVNPIRLSETEHARSPYKESIMQLRLELFVESVFESMDFYTRVLGFETVIYQPDDYSVFRKGSVQISLQDHSSLPSNHPLKPHNRPVGLGVEIVLEVNDIEHMYQQVQHEGWHIADPLALRPWGLRDFRVFDPNGLYIRITASS